ncbi:FeoA family protein [Lysobacter claricitrinus]|uniref:FeoA family protein n=1 Tax=Lysobacter claricitrinus TaxID=3367728 RepID=UPI0038B31082
MRLSELPFRTAATVLAVDDAMPNDMIARRLRELGFVGGEAVEVVASGPVGAEPLLVQVGFTRFALRRREADRIRIRLPEEVSAGVRPAHEAEPEAVQA